MIELEIKVQGKDMNTLIKRLNEAKAVVDELPDSAFNEEFKYNVCPNPGSESGDWLMYIRKLY